MRSFLILTFLAAAAWSPVARADLPSFGTTPATPRVYGGSQAEVCQWPTTVAVLGEGSLCTGALVHPQVVTYAAHCGGGPKDIIFGDRITPSIRVEASRCETNPDYLGTTSQGQDWAFCVLPDPIEDLPFTPPAYGCETEAIQTEQTVFVVGFGQATDENLNGVNAGTKHWGETRIVNAFGNTANIGGQGTGVSTCSGDSGGTAYLPMEDGSFRAISMVSTGLGAECNPSTGVHALLHPAVPWIEETSQIDITPCHDVDGTWKPTPNCTGFFAGGTTASGTWANMCEGTAASGPATTCGNSFEDTIDTEGPDVTITAPADGQRFETGELVTVEIAAVDDGYGVDEVWLEIAGMEQPVRSTYPPHVFADIPFPDGEFSIVAHATDWGGNESVSAPVTIRVNADVNPEDSDSAGDPDAPGDTSSTGTETEAQPSADDDSEGCSCVSAPTAASTWLGLPFVMLVARRRRRT